MAAKKAPTPAAQPVRTKLALTIECPRNPAHRDVQVYRTVDRTRYCKCNDCGTTWKLVADAAETPGVISDTDRQFLADLADGLETAPTLKVADGKTEVDVIQVNAGEAAEAAKTLRRIAA